jgi:hypothetical protein
MALHRRKRPATAVSPSGLGLLRQFGAYGVLVSLFLRIVFQVGIPDDDIKRIFFAIRLFTKNHTDRGITPEKARKAQWRKSTLWNVISEESRRWHASVWNCDQAIDIYKFCLDASHHRMGCGELSVG